MNFCSKCGTKFDESGICVNCNADAKIINDEKINKKKIMISKILAWISVILASLPILLVIYIFIEAKTSSDTSGLIAPVLVYYYFALVPNAVGSLVCGLISNKIKKNKLVSVGFFMNFLPLVGAIFYISMLIFGIIIKLLGL